MLKLFKYFRGDKIDCPMRLYRPEFIADLAKQETDRSNIITDSASSSSGMAKQTILSTFYYSASFSFRRLLNTPSINFTVYPPALAIFARLRLSVSCFAMVYFGWTMGNFCIYENRVICLFEG